MVGKLLSLDLKDEGVIISVVHPGFMRTEMTAGVGFDKFWDVGGAVAPEEAARGLVAWTEGLEMGMSGEYWAPRGPRMLSFCYLSASRLSIGYLSISHLFVQREGRARAIMR